MDLVPEHFEQRDQGLRRLAVVLDDEDAGASRLPRAGDERGRRLLGRHGERREPDAELGTASDPVAPRLDSTTVELDHALHDGEPDPEAALRAVEPALDLREELEHALQHVGRDADAAVAHGDDGVRPVAAHLEPYAATGL